MLEADYVIVGAGSAGCALAYRLSEDGRNKVLVLEYGGTDFGPLIQMPAAFSIPMNMRTYDWGYRTEPEPHLGGRRLATPRGKVIGGSSSINGMVFVRGHAMDFDRWEEAGASGWAFKDVLPYFKRMETAHGGEEGWRGTDGPLHVTRGTLANPLYARLHRGGRGGRLRADRRLQRLQAGRLWADGDDGVEEPALVGRQRLSPPGAEAAERQAADRRARREDRLRGTPRRRRLHPPVEQARRRCARARR